jgi:hypothetical protein
MSHQHASKSASSVAHVHVMTSANVWTNWPYGSASLLNASGSRWSSLGTVYDCCLLLIHVSDH